MKIIKNVTEVTRTYSGQELLPGQEYTIQINEDALFARDWDLIADIEAGLVTVSNGEMFCTSPSRSVAWIQHNTRNPYPNSWAADLNNVDLPLSGADWTIFPLSRVLWDSADQLDTGQEIFTVKKTGVYNWDVQARFTGLVNVTGVEIAVWKVLPDDTADYWFVLASKVVHAGDTLVHLGGATQFDFRLGERYYLAAQLIGTNPSATLIGNDDYTAWGASWVLPIVEV